MNSQMNI